ncbi:MAG: hypothetical protein ACOX09_04485 [Candidatus Kapaibacterium sp.]|jgi:hypothetical protein
MKKLTLLIALFILATPFVSGAPKRHHEIKEGSGWGRILNNDRQFKNVDRHPKFVTSNRYEKIHIGNKVCIAKKGAWGLPLQYNDYSDKSYASLLFYNITELGDTSMQFTEEVFQPTEEGASVPSLMNMRNPTLLCDTNHNLYLYYSDVDGLPDNLRDYLWKWDAENRKWIAKKDIYTKHFGQIYKTTDMLIPKMDKNNNMWLPNLRLQPRFLKYNVDTDESILIDLWDTLIASKKYGDSAELHSKYFYMSPFEMQGMTFVRNIYILEETGDIFYSIYLFSDNELNLEGGYGGVFRFNPNDVANDNDLYDFRKILNKKGTNVAIAQYNGEIYVIEFDNNCYNKFLKYNPNTKQFEDTKIFDSIIDKKKPPVPFVIDSSGNYITLIVTQEQTYSEEEECYSTERKLRYYDKDGKFIKEIDIPFNFPFFNIENVVGNRIYFNSHSWNNIGEYDNEEGEWSGLYWFDGLDAVTSIKETTEAGLLPDIWIRSISPNPASMRVTANIMYYPPGGVFGSEKFEVGLYNILGQKLIDLTHLGNYSDYNKTFEVTFDIPNSINNGAYFISVKNANEIRSKMLSIVRERE